jgi:hypothetical protein
MTPLEVTMSRLTGIELDIRRVLTLELNPILSQVLSVNSAKYLRIDLAAELKLALGPWVVLALCSVPCEPEKDSTLCLDLVSSHVLADN